MTVTSRSQSNDYWLVSLTVFDVVSRHVQAIPAKVSFPPDGDGCRRCCRWHENKQLGVVSTTKQAQSKPVRDSQDDNSGDSDARRDLTCHEPLAQHAHSRTVGLVTKLHFVNVSGQRWWSTAFSSRHRHEKRPPMSPWHVWKRRKAVWRWRILSPSTFPQLSPEIERLWYRRSFTFRWPFGFRLMSRPQVPGWGVLHIHSVTSRENRFSIFVLTENRRPRRKMNVWRTPHEGWLKDLGLHGLQLNSNAQSPWERLPGTGTARDLRGLSSKDNQHEVVASRLCYWDQWSWTHTWIGNWVILKTKWKDEAAINLGISAMLR